MNKQILTLSFSFIAIVISIIWLWSISQYSKDGYEPILASIVGLSGMLGAFFSSLHQRSTVKAEKEYDVFISTPMTSMNDEYEYMHSLSLVIKETIIKYTSIKSVYSASIEYKNMSEIDDEVTSANNDLQNLKNSKAFILIYPKKIVTSCLVEAGYAIALGIPCLFFVNEKNDLPYMLREIGQVNDNVLIYTYTNSDDLKNTIIRKRDDMFPFGVDES